MNIEPDVLLEAARRLLAGKYRNIWAAVLAVISERENSQE
jgi:hypothetical protein